MPLLQHLLAQLPAAAQLPMALAWLHAELAGSLAQRPAAAAAAPLQRLPPAGLPSARAVSRMADCAPGWAAALGMGLQAASQRAVGAVHVAAADWALLVMPLLLMPLLLVALLLAPWLLAPWLPAPLLPVVPLLLMPLLLVPLMLVPLMLVPLLLSRCVLRRPGPLAGPQSACEHAAACKQQSTWTLRNKQKQTGCACMMHFLHAPGSCTHARRQTAASEDKTNRRHSLGVEGGRGGTAGSCWI